MSVFQTDDTGSIPVARSNLLTIISQSMKEITRYIKEDIRRKLMERSNVMCECCGTDIPIDKHHIIQFSDGGKADLENLICLCQTCHKQLPTLLTLEQQHDLQTWHQTNTSNNYSLNHHISSSRNTVLLGNNYYQGCSAILSIYDQKIIRTYEKDKNFYLNAMMLKDFDPQLLVLGNRIIYSSDKIDHSKKGERITLQREGDVILDIEKLGDVISARMHFNYNDNGKSILFDFNSENSKLFNATFTGCTFLSDGGTAYSYGSSSGSHIRFA